VDEIGARYQALALRIGRHMPEYVDFWIGAPELKEAIAGEEPSPLVELHVEAVALHEACALLPADEPASAARRNWLQAQLGAMSGLIRRLDGEEIAFAPLVEVLFDVSVVETPDAEVDRAHDLLNALLPAGDSLRDRLTAHDAVTRIPPDRLVPAVEHLAALLRDRTRQDLGLPDGESVEVLPVRDKSWGAAAWFLGEARTRIEINVDFPVTLGSVVYLAAHETYPGHHAERVTKELSLWRERELGEAALVALFTPETTISEGLADVARGVVLTDQELGAVLRQLVRDLDLEIAAEDVEREVLVAPARDLLRDLTCDAALALHQIGLPEAEVREGLAERALRSADRVDHDMRGLRDPVWAAYAFTYAAGRRLIAPWLEAQGQSAGFARLLREQLSPGQLRAEIGEPLPLYPGSLA
jgi:hypothetical protein